MSSISCAIGAPLWTSQVGANNDVFQGTTIDMTSPVIIKSSTKTSFFKLSKYTMSFLLPSQHQLNPPKPLDPLVSITEEPDKKVYVRSYGQWMTTVTDRWNTWQLSKTLDSVGATYEGKHKTSVGYDSPMKMFDRRNEVWLNVEVDTALSAAVTAGAGSQSQLG
ncbi:Heme-binding protein 1 [Merluccius polli]|uniref:Heme-binding protein 1 n=1 Tax=Merluccius polli TaxID=89951 RepID=A0AA47MDF0_MERPO|nr:Heme-binding protein 1 [Merluccius polli]